MNNYIIAESNLKLVPEGEFMNDVGHVGVLRLRCGAVCGDVEVSRDLEKEE